MKKISQIRLMEGVAVKLPVLQSDRRLFLCRPFFRAFSSCSFRRERRYSVQPHPVTASTKTNVTMLTRGELESL